MPNNHLTLAVAGARKTQGIVDACVSAQPGSRILVLTYTKANQEALVERLAGKVPAGVTVEVRGWFSSLIADWVRPFVPFLYPGKRVHSFDFKSEPQIGQANASYVRYFNSQGGVRRVHLAQLAHRLLDASNQVAVRRLERMWDAIYIDEVQDLCGYDLELLDALFDSDIQLEMVGDVRQAIILTNPQEQKNSPYKFMKVWNWFRERETQGRLVITQSSETWRCRPEIAEFADSLFDPEWGFEATTSNNAVETRHDGLFLVRSEDVPAYLHTHNPLFLRDGANSGRTLTYDFTNFGVAKGMTVERVLVLPTGPIKNLLTRSTALEDRPACKLYVAVTRAEQSVAFVLDTPGNSVIPYWIPGA